MKQIRIILTIFILFFLLDCSAQTKTLQSKSAATYNVQRYQKSIPINANWNKPAWRKTKPLQVNKIMGDTPTYEPSVQTKLLYDRANVYVIFLVKEKYLTAKVKEINGPVWQDAAVEFFFAPDTLHPERYFNLEINAAGVPLMHYNKVAKDSSVYIAMNDIKKITIAHSFTPDNDTEIQQETKWTLEYKLPFAMLEKYATITRPGKGVYWRANFYKIAHKSSHPHYLSWSHVPGEVDMHLPQFFAKLKFQ